MATNLLKEFREKRGMTQEVLAEKCDCDINQNRISQIERGAVEPEEEEKIAISEVIDLPPHVIFPGGESKEDDETKVVEEEETAVPPEDDLPEPVGNPEEEDEDIKEILGSVEQFASRMVSVLAKHTADKDGWKDEKLSFFVDKLEEEYEEVTEAIMEIDERLLYKELIDVANVCMMMCEVLATRKNSRASL